MNITSKGFLKYTLLPEFIPRISTLFASGFHYIPYLIAIVYSAVRLLPANHPFLNATNIGKYGIRHVIAAAANNLVFDVKHIDQIILFVAILVGLVLAAMQIGLIAVAIMAQPAIAAMPTNFAGFFVINEPQDLSFIMLDLVFGVPGVFDSCIATPGSCLDAEGNAITSNLGGVTDWAYERGIPFPIHNGLHALFQVYSLGLMVVAALIATYFIATVIAETAQSGTPFGKRFNKVWAPIRIVVAFGLLIPLGVGLNTSQFVVLYAAKYGAGFATAGYNLFTDRLATTTAVGIDRTQLVSEPNAPRWDPILQFLFTARTCKEATDAAEAAHPSNQVAAKDPIEPFMVRGQGAADNAEQITAGTTYDQLIGFAARETQVVIRFGRVHHSDNPKYAGYVAPTCGEIILPLNDPRPVAEAETAMVTLQETSFDFFKDFWFDVLPDDEYALAYAEHNMTPLPAFHSTDLPLIDETIKQLYSNIFNEVYRDIIQIAVTQMQASLRFDIDANIRRKGWACAACSYNRIAEMNGWLVTGALSLPLATKYPEIMEKVHEKKKKEQQTVKFAERFKPETSGGKLVSFKRPIDNAMAEAMWSAYDFWQQGTSTPQEEITENVFIDSINALMGTEGIFNMRRNADIHPLAQLSGAGRSLVEASIRNLSYAAIGVGVSAVGGILDPFIGQVGSVASGFLITIAMVTLTAGFVLFYVVPYLPFIYFFFSFGGWVKGIFEAMVGAPLWALAHIRIDGNGLSGQAALSGYYLILEIFLRPIMMVFGLLGSIAIFSALVKVLNMIFELVVGNMGGFDVNFEYTGGGVSQLAVARGAIDQFFFTVIYVVIVYMMGMASFKLIDLVPNNILRWMGQSVATFGDQREDPTQKMVSTSTVGSQQATQAIGGGLQQLAKIGGGSG